MDISKLNIGDVIFTFNKKRLLSKIIYLISIKDKLLKKPKKRLSHASLYIGNGLIAEATFTGIVIVNIKKYLDNNYNIEFLTPINPLTNKEKEKIFSFAAEHAGLTMYSYGQLFVILFNKWFKTRQYDFSQKEMMCSEFVANAYEYINRRLVEQNTSMITPVDLYESELLKSVF